MPYKNKKDYAVWKRKKLAEDPGYFRRLHAAWRKRRPGRWRELRRESMRRDPKFLEKERARMSAWRLARIKADPSRLLLERKKAKAYRRTMKGYLVHAYAQMRNRVIGVNKTKTHLYKGKSLLNRGDFYNFALSDRAFKRLFAAWRKAGYKHRLCPSIDRIDSSKGYELGNMQFVTLSENSRRASVKYWYENTRR